MPRKFPITVPCDSGVVALHVSMSRAARVAAGLTVRTRVALPVPAAFVALMAMFVVAAVVGVPEIRPVDVLTDSPAGRLVAL